MQRRLRVKTDRERLELPDGDFLDLDWTSPSSQPLVLILHGLEGSIRSHYAAGIMNCLVAHGYQAVIMHFRGCSGEPNRLSRSYHSGATSDLHYVVNRLQQQLSGRPLHVIGFSLGGNALLKWLGETGSSAPPLTAVAVSVPFQLAFAADRLDRGLSRLYQGYLLRRLKRSLRHKMRLIALPIEPDIESLNNFWKFDDAVTAPLHGFKDVHDYYAQASSRDYLSRIDRPTLILQARDDPFMTPAVIPTADELSPHVRVELSMHGGHVGFISGSFPLRPIFWLEKRILSWLKTAR